VTLRDMRDHDEMSHDSGAIRILAVDDHQLIRQGIVGLIADQPGMTLVAEASNGREAIDQFRRHRPDVTLMDLQMPEMNGLEAMTAIRAEFPEARIIVLTTYTGDVQVLRAIKAGASGYLLKSTLVNEMLAAIRAVHAGRKALSAEVSFDLAEHAAQDALSPLEVRVLRLIANGHTNKEIAAKLSVTEEAVKSQVRSILSKLGTDDRTHAAVIGLKRGIIEL
jgi:DNA-binding NarL/FixJ family response regulator